MALTRRALLEQIGSGRRARRRLPGDGNAGPGDSDAGRGREFQASRGRGTGRSVVILGAGIAGLVSRVRAAPRRLSRSQCSKRATGSAAGRGPSAAATASSRPAARTSVATFDPGLYFNAGPARIPSHAPSDPRLCAQASASPLETFVNVNRNAGWDYGGQGPSRTADGQRHARPIGELLAKAIDQHALDPAVPKGELETIREFLGCLRRLDDKGRYAPGGSSGYAVEPAAATATGAGAAARRSLKELLPNDAAAFCPTFSTYLATCRRPCSSRSAEWIASPTPFTSR